MTARREAGFHLLHLLLTVVAAGILAALATPSLIEWTGGLRTRLAAGEVAAALRLARSAAVRHGVHVGIKFHVDADRVGYRMYRDGDGDGVRTADIERGDDPPLGPPRRLHHLGAHVRFGFPPGPPPSDPSDPGRPLDRLDDPIRFNQSDLASFSPLGTSTPGSAYVTDSQRHLAAVRLYGRTGKVKVLFWRPASGTWRHGG